MQRAMSVYIVIPYNKRSEDCYLDFGGFTRIEFSEKAFRGRGKIGTFIATISQRVTAVVV